MTKRPSTGEIHRALRALREAGDDWPDAWSVHNDYRTHSELHGGWPEYVFAPRQAAREVVLKGAALNERTPVATLASIGLVGTIAAWRPTQGIYRFAANLLDELWVTPVTGDLPSELLHRLPEWCVYIELDRATTIGTVHGAWARIGFDAQTREEELDVLLDMDKRPRPGIRMPLIGTLEESLEVTRRDMGVSARGDHLKVMLGELLHVEMRKLAEPIVSVVLYLCSVNAEIESEGRQHPRTRPSPRKRRSGDTLLPAASEPKVWATGTRLGAALRRARERSNHGDTSGDAPGVIPHIRRAHWHAYWLGAHDSAERRRELRWLPPIAVNLDDAPAVATVRPLPDRDR